MTQDFEIRLLNDAEVGVSALTERAQKARKIEPGHTLAFKSLGEAVPYVKAAEAEGLTFVGKELLFRKRGIR